MKFRIWINIIISVIMLIFSGYLLADSSVMSLDLLSNPNLNVAIELIRLFWGVVGVIYFLYYLYEGVEELFFNPATVTSASSKTTKNKPSRKRYRRRHNSSRKKNSSK